MKRAVVPRVVVTGAGGFIGPAVVDELLQADWNVTAVVGPPGVSVRPIAPAATQTTAEITDLDRLIQLTAGTEVVVHLAGPASVAASFQDPTGFAQAHVTGTAAVLEACRINRVRRLIYISSAEVYGRPEVCPVDEETPLAPRSPYGAAKAAAEMLVATAVRASDLEAVVLRPFSVYGPGVSEVSLLGTLLTQVFSAPRIELANLKPVRDYVYVGDVARAVRCATLARIDGLATCNIASGSPTSVAELAGALLAAIDRSVPVVEKASAQRPARAEIDRLIARIDRAEQILDWRPTTSLVDGLRNTVLWWRRLPCRIAS